MYESKAFQITSSTVPHAACKCRLLLDKYWHGRNRLKENDIDPQEALEIGQCRLCQAPDSQAHMLHLYTDATTASLRKDVLVTLRKAIFTNDKGHIFLQILQDTNEPERIWLGNLSSTQISYLKDNISPVTIGHFTQAQLNNVLLKFSRILAEGALSINQHRQNIEQHTPQLARLAGHIDK